jgi:hypothetical protein
MNLSQFTHINDIDLFQDPVFFPLENLKPDQNKMISGNTISLEYMKKKTFPTESLNEVYTIIQDSNIPTSDIHPSELSSSILHPSELRYSEPHPSVLCSSEDEKKENEQKENDILDTLTEEHNMILDKNMTDSVNYLLNNFLFNKRYRLVINFQLKCIERGRFFRVNIRYIPLSHLCIPVGYILDGFGLKFHIVVYNGQIFNEVSMCCHNCHMNPILSKYCFVNFDEDGSAIALIKLFFTKSHIRERLFQIVGLRIAFHHPHGVIYSNILRLPFKRNKKNI